jgi:CheY-like chemotaxis protein
MMMERQLSHAGFEVVLAAGASRGLEILRADDSVRVVLLDMMMPVLDGWAFRQAQLATPGLSDIPAVVLTGAPLPALSHEQLRAADYLLKPVGREHLISVVSNYCEPLHTPAPAGMPAS